MLLNVWTISVLILVIFLVLGINVSAKTIIKCFIPNFLCTNWFITCYILLYLSHPVLNTIISSYSQKQHLAIVSVLFGLYFLLGFIKPNNLFIYFPFNNFLYRLFHCCIRKILFKGFGQ